MKQSELTDYQYGGNRPWQNEELLHRLYSDEGLTSYEIADELDCSQSVVSRWLRKYNIDTGPCGKRYDGSVLRDKEKLEELYIEKKQPIYKIASEVDCTPSTVVHWLEKYGIERRTLSEVHRASHDSDPVNFFTTQDGYETWAHAYRGETTPVPVHRLLAVTEFGFSAIEGKHVHHKNGISWCNWGDNIESLTNSEHGTRHRREELENGTFETVRGRGADGTFLTRDE